ncbi:MAG: hypothetical protein ACRD3W_24915 [Terriglobales bacterium]
MKSLFSLCILIAATVSFSQSASAQSYHMNGAGTRVIYQNQTGLMNPSGTYIGSGTMSQSARGLLPGGPQANPNLPRVNMGAHIATPGDNQYGANRTTVGQQMVAPPGNSPVSTGLPSAPLGAHIGTPGDEQRSDLHPEILQRNQQFKWPEIRAPLPKQRENIYTNTPATYDDGQPQRFSY